MSSSHCNDQIYCIEDFKDEIEKLRKNNSYQNVDELVLARIKDKTIDEFKTGTNLNLSPTHPYIKCDVGGRSGLRMYYTAILHKGRVYLAFIHPKTGSLGSSNTTSDGRAYFIKKITECIKNGDLYKVGVTEPKLKFTRVKKPELIEVSTEEIKPKTKRKSRTPSKK